jgi:dephospho-CoA kinase
MNKMRFIGITGGVGAGKSEILSYLSKKQGVRVLLADEIAHELMEPGTDCYRALCDTFSQEDIFQGDSTFDRPKLASVIFSSDEKRERLNSIVHPAVKSYVCNMAKEERKKGELSLLVLEAALLIEEHYDEICDEIWYIYTDEATRRARLKVSRGYTDKKTDMIFASQMGEAEYRAHCSTVIDNNGTPQAAFAQIEEALRRKV